MDSAPTLAQFFESWDFFSDAVVTGTVAGALLGVMGVYVVLRRMVFLAAAVGQVSSLGVVLALWCPIALGVDPFLGQPLLGAAVLAGAVVLVVATGAGARSPRRDAFLGLAFIAGAAGTLALGTRIVEDLHDVDTLLLGNAVAVVPEDFELMMWLAAVLLPLHAWWHRGFVAVSFDRAGARVRRLPVRTLEIALWTSVALAIGFSTRILGALPTFAFSVLPAMAAVRLAPNVPWALMFAAAIGAAVAFGGYVLAFLWELPVGATQALLAAAVSAVVWTFAAAWRRLR